jgi:hypothetical protein
MVQTTRRTSTQGPLPISLWILCCVYCNCTGWLLSLAGQLNATGYLIAFAPGVLALVWWLIRRPAAPVKGSRLRTMRLRFRRPFALAFLVLATAAVLGGALYAPSNADALTQRIPRVLNWLAEGGWHWIENSPSSFNTRASGFEWLMAPMLALLRTDRLVFLFNAYSYLLFPGLVFMVFTRLGVSKQVAWHWMWLVPTGYCFILQAGSIGNDAVGAVFALAAVGFALRAKTSRRCSDVWLSCLSAGLLTSSKTSNLTLLLPWLLALWPSLRLLKRHPVSTTAIALAAAGSSFLPTALLNQHYTRDWTGAGYELPPEIAQVKPHIAFAGNALNLIVQNLVPPLFPAANWWNENAHNAIPKPLLREMEKGFEPGGAHIKVHEMQLESDAALGFGLTLLMLGGLVRGWFARGEGRGSVGALASTQSHSRLVRLSPWVSLVVYMVKAGLSTSGRIIAPYYPLLLPSLLVGVGQKEVVRQRWWRTAGMTVFCLAALLVALNPGRPLWPARATLGWLHQKAPGNPTVTRAQMLYESYAVRPDALASARGILPPGEKNVGFLSLLTSTTLETSLWRPFGERRIRWVRPADSGEDIAGKGIRFVLIGADSSDALIGGKPFRQWLEEWTVSHKGRIVGSFVAPNVATKPPSPWFVVKLPGNAEA